MYMFSECVINKKQAYTVPSISSLRVSDFCSLILLIGIEKSWLPWGPYLGVFVSHDQYVSWRHLRTKGSVISSLRKQLKQLLAFQRKLEYQHAKTLTWGIICIGHHGTQIDAALIVYVVFRYVILF